MTLWIIESRNDKGELLFRGPQPEEFFGMGAIHGMTDWDMSPYLSQASRRNTGRRLNRPLAKAD